MIEKISGCECSDCKAVIHKKPTFFTAKSSAKDTFVSQQTQEDVKNNFTFKLTNEGLGGVQILNGKSKISGKCYGMDYELNRNATRNTLEITGKIGDKPVNIKCKRKNIFSFSTNIEGFVGDKNLKLKETRIFSALRLRGNFGDENIKLTTQKMRYNDLITGEGVNMSLMYYISYGNQPKYVGEYNLDPEFLPVLAAIYRYS